jgi:hypothetical protein
LATLCWEWGGNATVEKLGTGFWIYDDDFVTTTKYMYSTRCTAETLLAG